MTTSQATLVGVAPVRSTAPLRRVVVWSLVGTIVGALIAYLVSLGFWFLVPPLLLVVPTFVVLHRYPMAAVSAWIIVTPLVVVTESGAVRIAFTLVHRVLPPVTLLIVITSAAFGIRPRKLPRLGWPEVVMLGYVVATLVSIAYRAATPVATTIILYDRVVVPMFLYLIVRLLEPDERQLRRLLPAVVFLLISQSVIGLLQWNAPGVLPHAWLTLAGLRTTGSIDDPNVFGSTMIFCAMASLIAALTVPRRTSRRLWWLSVFGLSMFMVFFTFGRADWLAATLTLTGCSLIYRGFAKWLIALLIPTVVVLTVSGVLATQFRFAEHRFKSDQSVEEALSRLPVVFAAVRMFEAQPLVGWGYEQFDLYSRSFQSRVGNLVYPVKPHASHNLYLSLLAEQGLIGIVLFLLPTLIWFTRSRRAARTFPPDGFTGRRAFWSLWLVVLGYLVVNNFAVMHVPFGLGLWWLTLGLLASFIARRRDDEAEVARAGAGAS